MLVPVKDLLYVPTYKAIASQSTNQRVWQQGWSLPLQLLVGLSPRQNLSTWADTSTLCSKHTVCVLAMPTPVSPDRQLLLYLLPAKLGTKCRDGAQFL